MVHTSSGSRGSVGSCGPRNKDRGSLPSRAVASTSLSPGNSLTATYRKGLRLGISGLGMANPRGQRASQAARKEGGSIPASPVCQSWTNLFDSAYRSTHSISSARHLIDCSGRPACSHPSRQSSCASEMSLARSVASSKAWSTPTPGRMGKP